MGNRAVITTRNKKIGVYLHWNGGKDSVEAFLAYCKLKGYRCPEKDNYGWARLCQVIGNFFGGECSVGIGLYETLDIDNGDNGVYIIENWEIVGREFGPSYEQKSYTLDEMLEQINSSMPEKEQIDIYARFTPKERLLKQLEQLSKSKDTEIAHADADKLILNYLDDSDIKAAYEKIKKWYA